MQNWVKYFLEDAWNETFKNTAFQNKIQLFLKTSEIFFANMFLQSSKQLYNILQDYAQLDKKHITQLYKHIAKLYKTIHNFTQVYK